MRYAIAAWEHATGTDSTGKSAVAAMAFVTPSSTGNQVVHVLPIVKRSEGRKKTVVRGLDDGPG
jgi:hypothetical protein